MDQVFLGTPKIRPYVFLYTSLSALITILACWAFALSFNLPRNMWCPPISFTGFLYPERAVYITGFTLTFVLSLIALKQLRVLFTKEAGNSSLLGSSIVVLFVALLGMQGQALVPFQKNIFTAQLPRDIEIITILHLLCAALFFYGVQIHAILVLIVSKIK